MIDPFMFHLMLPTCVNVSKQFAEDGKQIADTEGGLFVNFFISCHPLYVGQTWSYYMSRCTQYSNPRQPFF